MTSRLWRDLPQQVREMTVCKLLHGVQSAAAIETAMQYYPEADVAFMLQSQVAELQHSVLHSAVDQERPVQTSASC